MLWPGDTPIREAISGATPAPQAVYGDASSRNEKSDILALCLLVGGVLFRPLAIRDGASPGHRACDTPGSQKAPSAKRCIKTCHWRADSRADFKRQKAPSAKRCIITTCALSTTLTRGSQKAPSAKRCIKTARHRRQGICQSYGTRKHRAPKGALRPCESIGCDPVFAGQKAPSAKRCIKTFSPNWASCCLISGSESTERHKVH